MNPENSTSDAGKDPRPQGEIDALLDEADIACGAGESYLRGGDYAKAAAVYRYALHLSEKCSHLRRSANAGLGLGQALVELQRCDEAIGFLETARVRFARHRPYPIRRGVADCDQCLGRAFQHLGRLDEAVAAYRRALPVYTDPALGLDAERISCALNLANAVATTGAYSEALAVLDDVEYHCPRRADVIKVAVNRGVFYAESGRYAAAHEQLERARATAAAEGRDDLVAACDTDLGYVHTRVGRFDHAESAYGRARSFYEHRDRPRFATCWMNLGTVYGSRGDHARAITAYVEALELFEVLDLPERVAACRMNLGVEHAALGELDSAKDYYRRAKEYFDNTPGKARQAAGCTMNLARLDDRLGHHEQAQEAYRSAGAEFRALGLYEWEARCAVNLASSLAAAPSRADGSAVDLLLPALLYLDSVKYQFPTAAARSAWRHTVTEATRLAFEWAIETGDAELVAELVETAINSGIHTHTHDSDGGHSTAAAVEDEKLLRLSKAEWTAVDNRHLTSVRLVAGAVLPMAAPPQLRMPTGAVALARFHEAAQHYRAPSPTSEESSELSSAVVDTW
ncbi:tetratricopeptide repeat protein [Nocardia farcinica]|uniref:tetratricopeptide repeat protein n=1 Tax=Nocardia farcinica TaxID=37329 RepID=UPI002455E8EE|nr:tetratricopeptide repeat protein [Nocardia farcinica]